MSCYHPYLGRPDYRGDITRYKITGWYDPSIADPKDIRIPCGKCIGCRLDYSRQWADRMILELDNTKKAVFATFTYNQEHVPTVVDDIGNPIGYTLDKKDFQDFMKRLRGRKKFEDREIRFYAAGEYGSRTRRPHYHAIIFGIDLDDFEDCKPKGMNELLQQYFVSKEFEDIWENGFTLLSEVSWRTCAYVSRYVMKKAYADDLEYFQVPEFSLMSRRPGIGAYYFEKNPGCVDFSNIYVSDKQGSIKVGIPKYFLSKLKNSDNLADNIKYYWLQDQRKEFASDKMMLQLSKTDLSYVEQLEVEQEKFVDKVDILRKIRM